MEKLLLTNSSKGANRHSALSTALYAAFYFLAVKKHFGKTLFTLLMISNLANFAVISAKCIEGLFVSRHWLCRATAGPSR